MSGIFRACIDCGRPFPAEGSWNRCPVHRKGHDRPRPMASATARGYGSRHQTLRKRVLAAHMARFGLMCPGWLVPPHPVNHPSQLHLDHIIPLIDGGSATDENVQILCGRCNRRKGAGSTISPIAPPTVSEQLPPRKPKVGPFIR